MKVKQEPELKSAIESGLAIEMRCYTVTSAFLKNLEMVLKYVLQYHSKMDLFPAIFGAFQELVRWACLANMRVIHYTENNLPLNPDTILFLNEEINFLSTINSKSIESYREKLKKEDAYIQCKINHTVNGLKMQVINHSKTSLDQESYLRKYLEKAMKYTDIMEYFQDFPIDKDGRVMGLAFSIILLKESGLRPELMRMGKTGNEGGFSRLEIPFNESFKSIRDMILNDEPITPFKNNSLVPAQYQEELNRRLEDLKKNPVEFDIGQGF